MKTLQLWKLTARHRTDFTDRQRFDGSRQDEVVNYVLTKTRHIDEADKVLRAGYGTQHELLVTEAVWMGYAYLPENL